MLPCYCPSCLAKLNVRTLDCETCGTEVTGRYALPELVLLSPDDQKFVVDFIKCSGSLKEMSSRMRLSYPTVRNLLNEIILKLESDEK